jgi:hypothetical protein
MPLWEPRFIPGVSLVSLCPGLMSVNILLDSFNIVCYFEPFPLFICAISFLLLYSNGKLVQHYL